MIQGTCLQGDSSGKAEEVAFRETCRMTGKQPGRRGQWDRQGGALRGHCRLELEKSGAGFRAQDHREGHSPGLGTGSVCPLLLSSASASSRPLPWALTVCQAGQPSAASHRGGRAVRKEGSKQDVAPGLSH